ncbi:hypothetical protein J6590_003317 [Homalodisca vitripennis]|nr:hypothetical protein J6590_003317 [Homalodisca vitripennis]
MRDIPHRHTGPVGTEPQNSALGSLTFCHSLPLTELEASYYVEVIKVGELAQHLELTYQKIQSDFPKLPKRKAQTPLA